MPKLNGANVVNYLAELHKTAGDGKYVLPEVLNNAVSDICSMKFIDRLGDWYCCQDEFKKFDAGFVGVNESSAKHLRNINKNTLSTHSSFSDIANFVKWDLIHQKLKELNDASAR